MGCGLFVMDTFAIFVPVYNRPQKIVNYRKALPTRHTDFEVVVVEMALPLPAKIVRNIQINYP